MKHRIRDKAVLHPAAWIVLLCAAFLASPLPAVEDLVQRSPFIPEGWSPPRPPPVREPPPPPAQPQALDRLEFRGMMKWNEEKVFSLHDPTENRSFWIGLNQADGGFTVTEHDPREEAVVVRHEGRERKVSLRESKIQALAEAPPTPAARPATPGRPASQAQTPEERMRELAEEIRRRRAVRQQVVEQPGAAAPDTDQPPPEMPGLPPE